MLDVRELEVAITELENRPPTFSSCAKLADLYAVRDHITGQVQERGLSYSQASGPVSLLERYGDSDFLRLISGKDAAQVWAVMDELMDSLQVVNRRVYDSVMRKIGNL